MTGLQMLPKANRSMQTSSMANLFVTGCSFSDYTLVNTNWGEHLANKLGMRYVHMNRGGGSNDRSWREVTSKVLEGEITSDDLVIVQYTNIDRREFGATELGYKPDTGQDMLDKEQFNTPLGTFYTTAFKADSHTWQASEWDTKLHLAYQHTGGLSEAYALNHFYTQHAMFDCFCRQNNITVIYMKTRYTRGVEVCAQHVFDETQVLPQNDPDDTMLGYVPGHPEPDNYDSSHLSEFGHELLAHHVEQYIAETQVLRRD